MNSESDMAVGAWGTFDRDTKIKYNVGGEGQVELVIGGDMGFNLLVTDAGINRLAEVIDTARQDERRWRDLDD